MTDLKSVSKRLLTYVYPHRLGLSLGIGCFFLAAAMEPAIPALLSQLLDSGFKANLGIPLWLVPVVFVSLFVVRGILSFLGAYFFNWANSKAILALRVDLIQAVMRADARLYGEIGPGIVASRVINDPQNSISSITGALTIILRDGTTFVALMGYLFYLNWKLTLVSLVAMPLLAFVVVKVQRRVLALGGHAYESQVRLVGIVDDIARAWRVVRTFDASAFELKRFDREAQHLRRLTLKNAAAGATMTPLTQIVASLGVALILTLALVEVHNGQATVGEFVGFITAMLMTISPLRHLTDVSQPIIGGLIGARACFALMDTPQEPDTGTQDIAPTGTPGKIIFDQVSLTYPGSEQPALNRLDLTVQAGRSIALVGASGSGKSTIISALLGFVTTQSGCIALDGLDIATIRKASLRRQFAVVSQDIVLFDGSIAENVIYALPFDAAKVESCLRAANLWDFAQSLPEGLETTIGTNGSRLSGGQRQRLAIARALYKDASIWVFDEATSALDTESERVVQQSIEQWRGSKTLILIAHRLSTVRNVDCIHVLAEGRVIESGNHSELMQHRGLYAGMVQAQAML